MTKILYFITDMEPTCLKLALEHKNHKVGICLLQDAVYFGCREKTETMAEAIRTGIPIFAAKRDIELRGLTELIHPEIQTLSYHEIIDLVLDYEHIINF